MRSAALVEERTPTPLEPDTLVPAQYFDRIGSDIAYQPEKRLMLAVLEEAIATFQRHVSSQTPRSIRLVQDVEEWAATTDHDWPYSFENICAGLGLESEYLRKGMADWKAAERRRAGIGEPAVYRFPFRRVNGRRHSITGPREYLKKSA
jgi:hypothetical protein